MNSIGSLPQAGVPPVSALPAGLSAPPGAGAAQPAPGGVAARALQSPGASTSTAPPAASAAETARATRWGWRWWGGRRRRSELHLAAVRVVRNDLAGEDLVLLPRPSLDTRGLTLGAERLGKRAAGGGWRGWLAHWAAWWRRDRERAPGP